MGRLGARGLEGRRRLVVLRFSQNLTYLAVMGLVVCGRLAASFFLMTVAEMVGAERTVRARIKDRMMDVLCMLKGKGEGRVCLI